MRNTSARRHQGTNAQHPGAGRVSATRPTEYPRDLHAGQVRCPVCRNGVTPVVSGFLRQHRDLFGMTCYNRRPPDHP